MQIDSEISQIFREYNELSLIHESKLGHALKDMQQFLEYYKSSDETVQSVLSKLDMIIEIQEKKMYIEIFGENPLDCQTIRKHLKSSSGSKAQPNSKLLKNVSAKLTDGDFEAEESNLQHSGSYRSQRRRRSSSGHKLNHSSKKHDRKASASKQQSGQKRSSKINPKTNCGTFYQNIIKHQVSMQMQQLQKQQLMQAQLQQQLHQLQPPSQSLNLTILNNGQNFLNIPNGNQPQDATTNSVA